MGQCWAVQCAFGVGPPTCLTGYDCWLCAVTGMTTHSAGHRYLKRVTAGLELGSGTEDNIPNTTRLCFSVAIPYLT